MTVDIRVKRVYEPFDPADGFRVLVDRVWPRGFTKEKLHADLWMRDIAPSAGLRKWYCHDPAQWSEFKAHYFAELDKNAELVGQLLEKASQGRLTLLYAAREVQFNQAVALREYLITKAR